MVKCSEIAYPTRRVTIFCVTETCILFLCDTGTINVSNSVTNIGTRKDISHIVEAYAF